MIKRILIKLALLSSLFFLLGITQNSWSHSPTVVVISVNGSISPATQDFIKRSLKIAEKIPAQALVLRLDTPGGLSKSMRSIVKAILASNVPVITYVAPSGARAASAGTYILYASHIAAMAPGTNLGAATPVAMSNPASSPQKNKKQTAPSMTKAVNDAKAYLRSLAQLRGRNVWWAEKAVTHADSLSSQEALKKNVINLVANDLAHLLQKINQKTVLIKEKRQTLHTQNPVIKTLSPDWRTRFLAIITDPSMAYILLMIGFYGLLFEFMNPGYVLPGMVGGVCLLVALYALQLLPISYAGLSLIILGLALIVTEAFLPSFGLLSVGGFIAFIIGSIMLIRSDTPEFSMPWQTIAIMGILSLLFFLGVFSFVLRAHTRRVVSGTEGMLGLEGTIEFRDQTPWLKVAGEYWEIADNADFSEGDKAIVTKVEGLKVHIKTKERSLR